MKKQRDRGFEPLSLSPSLLSFKRHLLVLRRRHRQPPPFSLPSLRRPRSKTPEAAAPSAPRRAGAGMREQRTISFPSCFRLLLLLFLLLLLLLPSSPSLLLLPLSLFLLLLRTNRPRPPPAAQGRGPSRGRTRAADGADGPVFVFLFFRFRGERVFLVSCSFSVSFSFFHPPKKAKGKKLLPLFTSNRFPSITIPDLIAASRSSRSLSREESSASVGGGEKDEKRSVAEEEEEEGRCQTRARLAPSARRALARSSIGSSFVCIFCSFVF